MNRFFAPPESFDATTIRLDEGETRHLRDVLRYREGEQIKVFDGKGNEFEAVIANIAKSETALSIIQRVPSSAPESPLDLTVCAAILKGEKTDFAIQKSVELGVNRFVPMITERCDVRPKDGEKRVARWRKIVLEASKQCGRAKLMAVDEIATLRSSIVGTGEGSSKILLTERDGEKFEPAQKALSVIAFFGPEGGWDDSELDIARESGADLVTLSGRIMKADTAVIAISAILQHHFGDLN